MKKLVLLSLSCTVAATAMAQAPQGQQQNFVAQPITGAETLACRGDRRRAVRGAEGHRRRGIGPESLHRRG